MNPLVAALAMALLGGAPAGPADPFAYPADAEWRAQWVWGSEAPHGPNGWFRRTIQVGPGLTAAWAQMSGDDGYTLFVNGREVRRGGFWWKTTDRADLLRFLRPGANVLAARAANAAHPGGFLLQADLLYGGRLQTEATGAEWRFTNREPGEGWAEAGFDDSGWERCKPMGSPPAASPWGALPLAYAGPRFPVRLEAPVAAQRVRAGSTLTFALELSVPPQPAGRSTLDVALRDDARLAARASIPVALPARGGRVLLKVRVPVGRYASDGRLRIEAGLRGSRYTNPSIRGFRVGEVTIQRSVPLGTVTTAEVKPYHGAPTLHLNGKPAFALWFYQGQPNPRDLRAFHRAGVDVVTTDMPMGWTGPGKSDFATFDDAAARILDANPNAYLVPRLWLSAPGWWLDAHPDQIVKMADGTGWVENGLGGTRHESFASELWRREAGEALARLIRHVLASPYSDRVIGYHLGNGIYTEWHAWSAPNIPDISEPMRLRIAAFARRRYAGDEAALSAAWGMPDVTFDTVRCPTPAERRSGDVGVFRDPARSRFVADAYEAFHLASVEALLSFCRVVKRETRRRAFTLAFYGYLPDLEWPQEGDHRALDVLLRSPDIDCLSSPHSYERRALGQDGLFRHHPASVRLHGKLFIDEGDDRTHLANDPQFTHVKSAAEAAAVLRRAAANTLTHHVGMWYMDQQGNWFNDPRLMAEIARLRRLGDESLASPRRRTAQVAVVIAPHSDFHMAGRTSGLDHVTFALLQKQVGELCRAGAPFEVYLVDDLADARMPDYKLYVMLECFALTDGQRAAVRRKLTRSGATALWFYAPGYVTDRGLSAEAASELAGMALRAETAPRELKLTTCDPTLGPLGMEFGTGGSQSPSFTCADGGARPLARYAGSDAVGMASKGRAIFCAVPGLPAAMLRAVYRMAGVHIYADADDPLTADARFVALHTATAGAKTIRLPERRTVLDALTGATVARNAAGFSFAARRHETCIFRLVDQGAAPVGHGRQ